MSVFRIYVEKKKEFALEALNLLEEINSFLKVSRLTDLRVLIRYDVEGIEEEVFEKCKGTIFSSPHTDSIYDELPNSEYPIGVGLIPGQFDQRADSCEKCIQLFSSGTHPIVRTAKIYLLSGSLTEDDISIIKNYLINPVESKEVALKPYKTLTTAPENPSDVATLDGFRKLCESEIEDFLDEYNLAMDREDLIFCQNYFKTEGRDPTFTEIKMIDTYWSDHCRHTTFLTQIETVSICDKRVKKTYEDYLNMRLDLGRKDKPITLMDIATIGAKYLKHKGVLTSLDESLEVNACSVKIDAEINGEIHPWLLMFKNETHNHPTEIEPFGGASTCLGGAIRDPLSGRAYVYQAMRITGAADPLAPHASTMQGKLPQRVITTKAADGYSSYGNQIGLPAGLLKEFYHPGYAAKRMEMGAVVAAAPIDNVIRDIPKPGDVIMLLGGKTGRDGCGGATGSSKSHDLTSLEASGAEVQKGNALEERKIQRLFRDGKLTRLIKRCNDFGAGGVSVAVGELADSIEIDLDAVPVKYDGLDGTELAISESQERMAVVISESDVETFVKYSKEENLDAIPIAKVTDSGRLTMDWRGKRIVDISRDFLDSNGTPKFVDVSVMHPSLKTQCPPSKEEEFIFKFSNMLSSLNFCSQKGLVERFDSTNGSGTVLMPFGGVHQETPIQAMVAKLPVSKGDTKTCSAMSYGFDPYLTEIDPYLGSYYAVVESVAKLMAVGGDLANCWLSFQEYFEKLGNDPLLFGKPFSALLGALRAQMDLNVAAIGGKDSMSGSFEDLNVPPTLVSVAVSLCNVDQVISPEFKAYGNPITLLKPDYDSDGFPIKESLNKCFNNLSKMIKNKAVISAYAIGSGGIAEALFKMSLGNKIGVELPTDLDMNSLFEAHRGGFLLEWDSSVLSIEQEALGTLIGNTIKEFNFVQGDTLISLKDLKQLYDNKLENVFPTNSKNHSLPAQVRNITHKANKISDYCAPTVLISSAPTMLVPVFPGTSGEYDAAKAIEAAGGVPEIVIIKNNTPGGLEESLKEMATLLRKSQVLVLPGGMSCGNEPDGSAKFPSAFFRNQRLTEELNNFIEIEQGLVLGIGDGFQTLIKLGLLPFGKITDTVPDSPALTMNSIGRYQSKIVRTKILTNNSPWLSGFEVGDTHVVPISCMEGRFSANDGLIEQIFADNLVAAQYVDLLGNPSMDIEFNPCGSSMAIEALVSKDGRILGKMGHFERGGWNLYKNIPGYKPHNIFENAVKYYTL